MLAVFAGQCSGALEQVQMAIRQRVVKECQQELNDLKDQFMTTVSHELRTPLTVVRGYIELLTEYHLSLLPDARTEYIAKAHHGCDELVLLLESILDAGLTQSNVESVKLSSVTLTEAVRDALEKLREVTEQEHRALLVHIPLDGVVIADDMRLRQVLLNLVGNALKYSPPGTEVVITGEIDEDWVTVRIRDYGLGIPPEDQVRLFERFVRLERDMNSPVRGAGLGLYTSKQLIEAMGGRIWMESRGTPGEGSTFAFALKRSKDPRLCNLT